MGHTEVKTSIKSPVLVRLPLSISTDTARISSEDSSSRPSIRSLIKEDGLVVRRNRILAAKKSVRFEACSFCRVEQVYVSDPFDHVTDVR